MEPLYKVYHVNGYLYDHIRLGTMFDGDIVVNKFSEEFDTIHSVPHIHWVIVTRTRGMDVSEMYNPM